MPRRPETELAKPVLELLIEMGFDCYQEVPLGGRADIVGVLAKRTVCVVEAKSSLTFEVIAQAEEWRRFAHWRFVAVPAARCSDGRRLAKQVCEERGLGIIEVSEVAQITLYPRLNRAALPKRLLDALRPEHKTFAEAGSSTGKFWSPWRESVSRLVSIVQNRPGITLEELVKTAQHHWHTNASARACVARQIEGGVIKELRTEVQDRKLCVFLAEKP